MSFAPRFAGSVTSTDVWFCSISGNGLSPWQRFSRDLSFRRLHAAATDYRQGIIYIPGGCKSDSELESKVFYFKLTTNAYQEDVVPELTPVVASSQSASTTSPDYAYTFKTSGTLPPDAVDGFYPFEQAKRISLGPPQKPLVLYLTHSKTRFCRKQNQLLQQQEFQKLFTLGAFAWINVQQYPQLAQQYGVYKIPTWLIYNAKSEEPVRVTGVITLQQIQAELSKAY